MKRPILIALIGYIIGIIWGLYFKISIAFLYLILLIIYIILKKCTRNSKKKVWKYLKVVMLSKATKAILITTSISALFSYILVKQINNEYEKKYENVKNAAFVATIIEEQKEEQYYNQYKKVKKHYLLLKTKNKLQVGNKIQFNGEYKKPEVQRNEHGFDYTFYLKTQKLYGTVTSNSINILKSNNQKLFSTLSNIILNYSKNTIKKFINNKDQQDLLLGILLGKDDNMENEVKDKFSNSSLSHILAISGMHVSYIITGIILLLCSIKVPKNTSKIILIFMLLIFCAVTGYSPTVIRAAYMSILTILASLLHRRNDLPTSMSIVLWIILLDNPFALFSISVQLSFLGTCGILTFYKIFITKFYEKNKELYLAKKLTILEKIYKKTIEISLVSISAQISILPVIIYNFNNISFTFLISNILASILIGPIIILGFLMIFLNLVSEPISQIISYILKLILKSLLLIADMVSNLSISHILLPTTNLIPVIMYYILLLFMYYLLKHNILRKYKYKLIVWILIISMLSFYHPFDSKLHIHFIDVGQGDSTLIITPGNKKLLIDGGGNTSEDFNIGKSVLLPYLLDKGITSLDYVLISHFDTDHVGGILYLLQNIKIENVIIGKQFENSENYEEFSEIIKQKNIKLVIAFQGMKIKIEKNLYFDILWPSDKQKISDNSINNNSLVCKLNYSTFTMLFTGDIEEAAEKILISNYNDKDVLKSDVLKVAHHGSKTSTIKEFLQLVSPKIALIGVGKNNKFGHPNGCTIENISSIRK